MKISNVKEKVLSKVWKTLKLFTYQYHTIDGTVYEQKREVYDKGDGAALLMYNPSTKKVLLTQQFRMPAYINGVKNGIMTEVPAGMLDKDTPEDCIKREVLEETGYEIKKVTRVMDCFMTPGAVTEITYMFVAEYDETMKVEVGGGLSEEQEEIVIFEESYKEVKKMLINNKVKDAKTLILLQYAFINKLID